MLEAKWEMEEPGGARDHADRPAGGRSGISLAWRGVASVGEEGFGGPILIYDEEKVVRRPGTERVERGRAGRNQVNQT